MKVIGFFILIFLFLTHNIHSQGKVSINTNVLNLVASGPSMAFNYDMSPKWSIQLYGSTGKFNGIGYSFKTGVVDFKYHLSKNTYVGPYLRYIDKTIYRPGFVDRTGFISTPGRDFQGNGISSGASFGYQIIDNKRLNIESFVGGGYGRFISQRGDKTGSGFFDARIGILTGIRF